MTDLEKAHRASALDRYKTTGGKGSVLPPELSAARNHLESLTAAEAQAVEEVASLDRQAERLARLAELERARSIMVERRLVCTELQARVEALVSIFTRYHGLAVQFKALLRDTGQQITSQWRVENLIDEKLLGRALSRDLRVPDLAALDDRIFSGVLDRAVREVEKQG